MRSTMIVFIVAMLSLLSQITFTTASIFDPNRTAYDVIKRMREINGNGVVKGVDLSTNASLDSWKCFFDEKKFVIAAPRCYRSSGGVDLNLADNLRRMKEAGYDHENTHVYFFPSVKNVTKSIATQFNEFWDFMIAEKLDASLIWLDFEVFNPYWFMDREINRIRATQLVEAVKAKTQSYAIYANSGHWEEIFGSKDWVLPGSNDVVWFPHFDNYEGCDDFKPFAQFTKPVMKQYKGDAKECNVSIDISIMCPE